MKRTIPFLILPAFLLLSVTDCDPEAGADPYDTSDHRQDGYSIAPLERFFYSWKDRAIAPKPYQLQPFLVVEKKEKD